MSDDLAVYFIVGSGVIVVLGFLTQKFDLKRMNSLYSVLFAVLSIGTIVVLAVWANWWAFFDNPEHCWIDLSHFRHSGGIWREVPWAECQTYVTVAAVVLDLLLIGAIVFWLLRGQD